MNWPTSLLVIRGRRLGVWCSMPAPKRCRYEPATVLSQSPRARPAAGVQIADTAVERLSR